MAYHDNKSKLDKIMLHTFSAHRPETFNRRSRQNNLPPRNNSRSAIAAVILPGIVLYLFLAMTTFGQSSSYDRQVDALLAQMTLDEKIGQMVQVDSGALKDTTDVQKYFLGSVLSGGSSDPADGNSPESWLHSVSEFQNQ